MSESVISFNQSTSGDGGTTPETLNVQTDTFDRSAIASGMVLDLTRTYSDATTVQVNYQGKILLQEDFTAQNGNQVVLNFSDIYVNAGSPVRIEVRYHYQ